MTRQLFSAKEPGRFARQHHNLQHCHEFFCTRCACVALGSASRLRMFRAPGLTLNWCMSTCFCLLRVCLQHVTVCSGAIVILLEHIAILCLCSRNIIGTIWHPMKMDNIKLFTSRSVPPVSCDKILEMLYTKAGLVWHFHTFPARQVHVTCY